VAAILPLPPKPKVAMVEFEGSDVGMALEAQCISSANNRQHNNNNQNNNPKGNHPSIKIPPPTRIILIGTTTGF
jgi:hypothetical protein